MFVCFFFVLFCFWLGFYLFMVLPFPFFSFFPLFSFSLSLSLSFSQISRSSFGEVVAVSLVPGGSNRSVTMEDRAEYVRAYVRYILDESVKEPFQAFDEGFRRVCEGKVLVSE